MSGVGVIDLSAGPGEATKAALVTKRPYLGLCLTEEHVTLLYRHLVNWALSEMGSEGLAALQLQVRGVRWQQDSSGCPGCTEEGRAAGEAAEAPGGPEEAEAHH